jgi:hypothetical protein
VEGSDLKEAILDFLRKVSPELFRSSKIAKGIKQPRAYVEKALRELEVENKVFSARRYAGLHNLRALGSGSGWVKAYRIEDKVSETKE